jgi:hypothetical protein
MESGPEAFFEWVKYRSHLSRGVTIGTMLQDEALRFIRLGTFLERADNTARILEVKYLNLLPGAEDDTHSSDYYQWSALLHSVSAFEVYRKVYRDQITPMRVAELLILRADMPRSLAIHDCPRDFSGNDALDGAGGRVDRLCAEQPRSPTAYDPWRAGVPGAPAAGGAASTFVRRRFAWRCGEF